MGVHTAGWFLLAGFLAWVTALPMSPKMATSNELLNKESVKQKINRIQVHKKFLLGAIAMQIPAILQGIHLLGSGYDVDLTKADPSTLGRTAAKARGKGGIILLIIQFFPYFLIGGYGYVVYDILDSYKIENKRIKTLQRIYSYLSEATTTEIKVLERVAANNPGDGTFNSKIFFAQIIDEIEKRKIKEGTASSRSTEAIRPQKNQDQKSFTRDINLPSQPSKQAPSEDDGKPTVKGDRSKGESEEVDALEKELQKAEKLKQRGLISEEEYQALRKKGTGAMKVAIRTFETVSARMTA